MTLHVDVICSKCGNPYGYGYHIEGTRKCLWNDCKENYDEPEKHTDRCQKHNHCEICTRQIIKKHYRCGDCGKQLGAIKVRLDLGRITIERLLSLVEENLDCELSYARQELRTALKNVKIQQLKWDRE